MVPASSPSTVPKVCRAGKETRQDHREKEVKNLIRENKRDRREEEKKVRKTKMISLKSEMTFMNPIRLPEAPALPLGTCIVDTRGFEVGGVPSMVLSSPPFGNNTLTSAF